jgi:hypothetical protein
MSSSDTSSPLNRQHIVACLWDFDKTLCPHYMQTPLFAHYGIDEASFWREVNALPGHYALQGIRLLPEIAYLNHMLTYVRHGIMRGLNNKLLLELGKQVPLCAGLPEAFARLQEFVAGRHPSRNIRLEHYILSTGIKPMILGSAIAPFVDGVFASEFVEESAPPYFIRQNALPISTANEVTQIACPMDNTSKTRVIFEINKGSNKNPAINVNSFIERADRRVPFENMIYIADGPSDVPAFSVMRQYGGSAFAVYDPNSEKEFAQTDGLLQHRRVNAVGPADYTESSPTYRWLKLHLAQICDRIINEEVHTVSSRIGTAPRHISNHPFPSTTSKNNIQTELL